MIGYIIGGIALVVAVAMIIFSRWQTMHTIRRLDSMLTDAINGNFSERSFDESRLSSLESRLARYLMVNTLSAQRVAEQKNQISSLISDISHQTRTPVANLQLYTQLLAEQPLSPQQRDCVQAISMQAEKLQTLVEVLVKTSRLETGIITLHPCIEQIAPVVERAVAQYVQKAKNKDIALTCIQKEDTAVFDSKWTEEALCNLLDNAVKYTPAQGKITVEVKSYEMFSVISVMDTGPGIPEKEQAAIFKRFYRAPDAYQTDGVGIGLYLTRQIVQAQGGYIRVDSVPGKGSTFSIWLVRKGAAIE